MSSIRKILFALLLTAPAEAQPMDVRSPNGLLRFSVTIDETGTPAYTLTFDGKAVIRPSRLGVTTVDRPQWVEGLSVTGTSRRSVDETWKPVYGERSTVRNRYNELAIELIQNRDTNRVLRIIIRAYDEGAAFCYHFPERLSTSILHIRGESTEFAFEEGTIAYITPFAQELYHARPLTGWDINSLPPPLYASQGPVYECERPLTLRLPNGLFAALGEAGLVDHARMKFILSPDRKNTLAATLFGPVTESSPYSTPWRFILVAATAGRLIEQNDLLLNLNAPCAIPSTAWIRPGKVMREVTLSTAGAKEVVDFCATHNIQYVEFDAGWYGYEYSKSSDATKVDVDPRRNPKKDLDLHAVIAYARRKNVGVILYVNHRALERQIDEILPLYRSWGVAGLKYGFVHVGSQHWTRWLHEAVRKAARHELMVDIHDEYRPTGYSRTYPNLMTQEGVHGNECMPDANHNTILPFTRFLAGAADYTICYFHQKGLKNTPRPIKTTSAHQLGLSVIYYSPLQFVFWYDRPGDYQGEPEVEFFEHIPTVWDTTCVVHGEIGGFITMARRSGQTWFVGSITNNDARTLDVPLAFLDPEKTYLASLYTDGGSAVQTRTRVAIHRVLVDARTVIRAPLQPSGGMAAEIRPARAGDMHSIRRYSP